MEHFEIVDLDIFIEQGTSNIKLIKYKTYFGKVGKACMGLGTWQALHNLCADMAIFHWFTCQSM